MGFWTVYMGIYGGGQSVVYEPSLVIITTAVSDSLPTVRVTTEFASEVLPDGIATTGGKA